MTKIMATIRANFTIKVVRERDISEVTGFAVVDFIVFSFSLIKRHRIKAVSQPIHPFPLFFSLYLIYFGDTMNGNLRVKSSVSDHKIIENKWNKIVYMVQAKTSGYSLKRSARANSCKVYNL